jgi:hypothetical protein
MVILLLVVSRYTLLGQRLAWHLSVHMCPVLLVLSPAMELQDMPWREIHTSVLCCRLLMTVVMWWVAAVLLQYRCRWLQKRCCCLLVLMSWPSPMMFEALKSSRY